MKIESRRYRLTGFTPLLGSQPAKEEIRTEYIASKAPSPERGREEDAMLPDLDSKGLTVFLRRPEDDALSMMDYHVIAFLKAACSVLAAENGIKQAASKVNTYVFAEPRVIPVLRNGKPIIDEDSVLERPLRAQTMQGPRVALAASERVDDPWTIEFTLKLIANEGTPKSKAVSWEALEAALDYGALRGLGQWRNGGWGRFAWERVA